MEFEWCLKPVTEASVKIAELSHFKIACYLKYVNQ